MTLSTVHADLLLPSHLSPFQLFFSLFFEEKYPESTLTKNNFQRQMTTTRDERVQPVLILITVCPILIILSSVAVTVLTILKKTTARKTSIANFIFWLLLMIYGGLHLFPWKPVLMKCAPFFIRSELFLVLVVNVYSSSAAFGILSCFVYLLSDCFASYSSKLCLLSASHVTFSLSCVGAALYLPTIYFWLVSLVQSQADEIGYVFLIFVSILALGSSGKLHA